MSNTNLLGSEEWAVVGVIDPDANTAGTLYTDDIDMSLFEQILVVGSVGVMVAASTVDISLVSGAAATPTTAVTGKAATQLVGSPNTGDDKQVLINLRGDELTEGHRYVRAKMVIASAASDSAVIVLGKAKSLPSSDNDLASVTEIIS